MRVPPHLGVRDGKEERTGSETKQDLCSYSRAYDGGATEQTKEKSSSLLEWSEGGL